jgi:alkanesulfonate monooxygenase SsuD/methylene tetrahydromethanopterin reductase-like flavin-dependent oxidoreductase (luciferase family)
MGYDLSKLPERFSPVEMNEQIIASQASQAGLMATIAAEVGPGVTITRDEFYERGVRKATGYERTIAGTPAELADFMEGEMEVMGPHSGFMLASPYSSPRDVMDVVDFLVPELQRRGRFRTRYEGQTLRENLRS